MTSLNDSSYPNKEQADRARLLAIIGRLATPHVAEHSDYSNLSANCGRAALYVEPQHHTLFQLYLLGFVAIALDFSNLPLASLHTSSRP